MWCLLLSHLSGCHFWFGPFPKSENTKFVYSSWVILLRLFFFYTFIWRKLLPGNSGFCVLATSISLSSAWEIQTFPVQCLGCYLNLKNPITSHYSYSANLQDLPLPDCIYHLLTHINLSRPLIQTVTLHVLGDTSTVWDPPREVI